MASKKSKIAKRGLLYSLKGDADEIDLDDELVADEGFAAVLNDDREIYVGNKFYKYTTNGLYFCKRKHEKEPRKYLKNLGSTITSKDQLITAKCIGASRKSESGRDYFLFLQ
ncbi:MAG: hypothetical protein COC08_06055 [Maribacter sp.]|nr:MAG: hypothetical protein COC08_06055 [Maribacter sp.]